MVVTGAITGAERDAAADGDDEEEIESMKKRV